MENMQIVNGILIAILAVATITGFVKGFFAQVLELAGMVASSVLAELMGWGLAGFLHTRWGVPYSPALVISFLVIVVVGIVASHLIAKVVRQAIHMTILSWVDRFTGAVLGLILGMVVASLLISVSLEMPIPKPLRANVERSSVSLFLRPVAGQIFNIIASHGPKGIRYEDIFRDRV